MIGKGKGSIVLMYGSMSPRDQHTFRWWAKANAISAAMLVAVLLTAGAIASSEPSLPQVAAKRLGPAEFSGESKLAAQRVTYEPRR